MLYPFNYSKLIDEVYAKGLSSYDVAEALGISERRYLRKLSNQEEFTQQEINVLVIDILGLAPECIPEYFFTLQI